MKTATKSNLTKELEKHLPEESLRTLPATQVRTGNIVDVMANLKKIRANAKEVKTFVKFVHNFLTFVKNAASGASRIDLVFDSYIERTIKYSATEKSKHSCNRVEQDRKDETPPKANRHILAISEKQSTP